MIVTCPPMRRGVLTVEVWGTRARHQPSGPLDIQTYKDKLGLTTGSLLCCDPKYVRWWQYIHYCFYCILPLFYRKLTLFYYRLTLFYRTWPELTLIYRNLPRVQTFPLHYTVTIVFEGYNNSLSPVFKEEGIKSPLHLILTSLLGTHLFTRLQGRWLWGLFFSLLFVLPLICFHYYNRKFSFVPGFQVSC